METPIPEDINVQKTLETLQSFDERVEALDKTFDKKTDMAVQVLDAFEKEFGEYLKGKGIKTLTTGSQISPELSSIAIKIVEIGHKIRELRKSPDFSIKDFENTKLALPEEALQAGFRFMDNNTIENPYGATEFLPEEGVITGLSWQNDELLVVTSENLKFGIKLEGGGAKIREVK